MATMNAQEVTVGSALATGAIFVAPVENALPTDATTALDTSIYKLLGFTSTAGVKISESRSTQSIPAWEGLVEVYNVVTEYSESVAFTPIQCNADVAALTWGASNVTVDTEAGTLVCRHTAKTLEPVNIVIETVPREGIVRRYCMTAQLSKRADQTLDGKQIDGRELTFKCIADSNGVTCYEYTAFTVESDTEGE